MVSETKTSNLYQQRSHPKTRRQPIITENDRTTKTQFWGRALHFARGGIKTGQ